MNPIHCVCLGDLTWDALRDVRVREWGPPSDADKKEGAAHPHSRQTSQQEDEVR
jgi:hypothetical protein